MQVIHGDIFAEVVNEKYNGSKKAITITTNGITDKNGNAVMGKGIALTAKQKFPGIEVAFGRLLNMYGNHVFCLGTDNNGAIFSFPTKHHWRDRSDIELIKQSCHELIKRVNLIKFDYIFLPPVGCGNGGLNLKDVLNVVMPILREDKYIMCVPDTMTIPNINGIDPKFTFEFTQEEVNELTRTLMGRLDLDIDPQKKDAMKRGNEADYERFKYLYDINKQLFDKISHCSKIF